MNFIRAMRTSGAQVMINPKHIAAMEHQEADNLNYTAIVLVNGREIDVQESLEDLAQQLAQLGEP